MKYIYQFLFVGVVVGSSYLFYARITAVPEKSPLQEIAQEGIKQPEGMPVILQEGQTRETYYAKQTTMPKKSPKTTKVTSTPLGSSAPIVTASTAPVEAPKLPSETIVTPIIVNVPAQPQPATQPATQTVTVTPQPEPTSIPLEAIFSVIGSSVRILTNQEILIDQTTLSGGVSLVSSMKYVDGAQRTWKNTKNPAYLYEISTNAVKENFPFSVTITTGKESLTREVSSQ